ncbi:hypothetical protein tinsulaeT_37960 [Thalassotalea insulae]|uniref:DUF4870 domain-containing protein n=1 Tax=Thalassotalea insulae TaxID=2056778 RepID=A0ABQ6GWY8_9GAMM|nr:hypothetical protein [Thalassotalea insulae]GLX80456.1 hypothetical protein tinsulaeT_37960 [Thalassotalea insulae]
MHYHSDSSMQQDSVRFVSVLAYFTIVGWLIAAVMYGRQKSALSRFHLRQSLGLTLTAAVLAFIPLIGWLLSVLVLVAWFVSVYYACLGQKNVLPILGDFYQIHLDFIK